jgi:hypothetical protein
LTNKFREPLNKVLELLISIILVALGAIVFIKIMTPIENSLLYGLEDLLRFALFVISLFLIIFFIAKPLFKVLKGQR